MRLEKNTAVKHTWLILIKLMTVSFLGLALVGCSIDFLNLSDGSKPSRKANSNSFLSFNDVSGYYHVRGGDTLYSIAFKYGIDYRVLASLNGISAPYVIYPKQKIRLSSSVPKIVDDRSKKLAQTKTKVVTKTKVSPTKKSPEKASKKPQKTESKITKTASKPLKWIWPVKGRTLKGFSNKGVNSKGIDIKGSVNDAVLSAADGIVVYAGNGLIGYGNLVIVKHNEVYLSAYAYNQKIMVKEQQRVKAGDKLAIIGGKGAERSLLHFEVRKDGQPIDPLTVLPKR